MINSAKDSLFIKALEGKKVARPPVWIMRQAGRYLPDFMKLKNKFDFLINRYFKSSKKIKIIIDIQEYDIIMINRLKEKN